MRVIEKYTSVVFKISFLSPFLFIAFFVLSGFHEMQDYSPGSSILLPLFTLEILVFASYFIFLKISGSGLKAALITNLIFLPALFFGPAYELFCRFEFIKFLFRYKAILVFLPVTIVLVAVLILKSKNKFARFNTFLFTYGFVVVLIEIFKISVYSFNRSKLNDYTNVNELVHPPANMPAKLPDVYYLVFDMHAGYESLNTYWHYSDSTFIRHLESKGFCVVKNARSNYNVTLYSIASSLNMEYLDKLPQYREETITLECTLADLIRNNKVVKIFNSIGYDFVNLSLFDIYSHKRFYSQFYPFSLNKHLFAKTVFSKQHLEIILNTTITHDRILGVIPSGNLDNAISSKKLFSELIKLPEKLNNSKPAFVYAHFLIPHWPYIFDKNGEVRSVLQDKYEDKEKYLDQLIYTDKIIAQLVDTLLSHPENPPIIIIQGDHGFNKFTEKNSFNASVNILNAYYFPNGCRGRMYDSITPVNTFPVVFNSLYNFQFQLQEDRAIDTARVVHSQEYFLGE